MWFKGIALVGLVGAASGVAEFQPVVIDGTRLKALGLVYQDKAYVEVSTLAMATGMERVASKGEIRLKTAPFPKALKPQDVKALADEIEDWAIQSKKVISDDFDRKMALAESVNGSGKLFEANYKVAKDDIEALVKMVKAWRTAPKLPLTVRLLGMRLENVIENVDQIREIRGDVFDKDVQVAHFSAMKHLFAGESLQDRLERYEWDLLEWYQSHTLSPL